MQGEGSLNVLTLVAMLSLSRVLGAVTTEVTGLSQVEITGQSGECEISIYVLGQSDERMRFLTEFVE